MNENKLLHTMIGGGFWHECNCGKDKNKAYHHFSCKSTINSDYLANRRDTVMILLEEVPKRYGDLWEDFKTKYGYFLPARFRLNRFKDGYILSDEVITSPTFISDFLKFAVDWFKEHKDDKCEECYEGAIPCVYECEDGDPNCICPSCNGTGKKWWKEIEIIEEDKHIYPRTVNDYPADITDIEY